MEWLEEIYEIAKPALRIFVTELTKYACNKFHKVKTFDLEAQITCHPPIITADLAVD